MKRSPQAKPCHFPIACILHVATATMIMDGVASIPCFQTASHCLRSVRILISVPAGMPQWHTVDNTAVCRVGACITKQWGSPHACGWPTVISPTVSMTIFAYFIS